MILIKLVLFLVDKLSVTVVFFQLESILDGQVFTNPSAGFPHCQLLKIVFRNRGGGGGDRQSPFRFKSVATALNTSLLSSSV